jgi:CDP-glucose 4,6-dehydratase
VFLTGHTGFKGGWLALMLTELRAEVHGYALAAPTSPSFFAVSDFAPRLASHTIADIRDFGRLRATMSDVRPDLVMHLAAQPLVRRSYREPLDTVATNVIGTANVLQAASEVPSVRAVVNVTSDKCYENRERIEPYCEGEAMGGFDPYSASKGCAEILTSAWRRSFLKGRGVRVASARAGNVIGGGDWAEDRLVPDFLRAIDAGQELVLRSPASTRPWQHVLEPLTGYLLLAEGLLGVQGEQFAEAWNFGPSPVDVRSVEWMAEKMCAGMPGSRWRVDPTPHLHEAALLSLDSTKAMTRLGWRPRWDAAEAVSRTLDWHRAWSAGADMLEFSIAQMRAHSMDFPADSCSAGSTR